jgi:hypothetical protein
MFKPRKSHYIILSCLLVAGAVLCEQNLYDQGPWYHGHFLRTWLRIYNEAYTDDTIATRQQAAEAVRSIGTNAIPYLLKWTGSRESIPILGKGDLYTRDLIQAQAAFEGISILGPTAKTTIPTLFSFINDTNIYSSRYTSGKHKAAWASSALRAVETGAAQ